MNALGQQLIVRRDSDGFQLGDGLLDLALAAQQGGGQPSGQQVVRCPLQGLLQVAFCFRQVVGHFADIRQLITGIGIVRVQVQRAPVAGRGGGEIPLFLF